MLACYKHSYLGEVTNITTTELIGNSAWLQVCSASRLQSLGAKWVRPSDDDGRIPWKRVVEERLHHREVGNPREKNLRKIVTPSSKPRFLNQHETD